MLWLLYMACKDSIFGVIIYVSLGVKYTVSAASMPLITLTGDIDKTKHCWELPPYQGPMITKDDLAALRTEIGPSENELLDHVVEKYLWEIRSLRDM
jgi:hypothetical protein